VWDANNGLVVSPGVTQFDFSTYSVDLHADATDLGVTYSWDTSQAPDATSITGASTYRLQFTWASFTGTHTDSVTITVTDPNTFSTDSVPLPETAVTLAA
jgi:hypothetical protein